MKQNNNHNNKGSYCTNNLSVYTCNFPKNQSKIHIKGINKTIEKYNNVSFSRGDLTIF